MKLKELLGKNFNMSGNIPTAIIERMRYLEAIETAELKLEYFESYVL